MIQWKQKFPGFGLPRFGILPLQVLCLSLKPRKGFHRLWWRDFSTMYISTSFFFFSVLSLDCETLYTTHLLRCFHVRTRKEFKIDLPLLPDFSTLLLTFKFQNSSHTLQHSFNRNHFLFLCSKAKTQNIKSCGNNNTKLLAVLPLKSKDPALGPLQLH